MAKLKDKVAIIAGGAMGMGNGAAWVMAKHGAAIALVDYSDKVIGAAEELKKAGYQAVGYQVDVRDAKGLKEAYQKIFEQFGSIDILVNSAGGGYPTPFLEVPDEDVDRFMDINFKGMWNSCQAAVPYMVKAQYGKIVNFSSVTGVLVADPGWTAYAATKGAIAAFTRALAQDLVRSNITVNAILPGMVATPLMESGLLDGCPEDPERLRAEISSGIPMGRMGTMEEAGDLVAFLASDESRYITGTQIVFDGGSTLPETPSTEWGK